MQTLNCPNCSAHVPAGSINIAQTIAVCNHCDTVFDFGKSEAKQKNDSPKPKRRKMHPPQNFDVRENNGQLELSWRWFTPMAIFMTFFVIFWDGFLFKWYSMALDGGASGMALFALGHVAAGIGMTYYTLGLYFNRTTISVDKQQVRIQTLPLPFPRRQSTFNAADIEQIYVKRVVRRNKNSTSITYDVMIQPYGSHAVNLVRSLQKDEFALYIEQEIESYLGIENRPVPSEYGSSR